MPVRDANSERMERYDRWYDLFLEELDLVGKPHTGFIAIGNTPATYLRGRGFPHRITKILHYSGMARRARARAVVGLEERFGNFLGTVTMSELLATARRVLEDADIPASFRRQALTRLARSQLSGSRQQLMFAYKVAFEAMRQGRQQPRL